MEYIDTYVTDFDQFERHLDKDNGSNVHHLRQAGISRFKEMGFPTTKQEEWRFTNITPLVETKFNPVYTYQKYDVTKDVIENYCFTNLQCCCLVFINGHYAVEFSTVGDFENGVIVSSLIEAMKSHPNIVEKHLGQYAKDDNSFVALNNTFIQDGTFIYVPRGIEVEKPIHLLFFSFSPDDPIRNHPRNLFVLESNAKATIIEHYAGMEDHLYFTNPITEMVIDENSEMDHYRLQEESRRAYHISSTTMYQARDSRFSCQSFDFGGKLVRNDPVAIQAGENVSSTLNGLYVIKGDQHVDNHTTIDHAKPHGQSHELYKGIMKDNSRAVFNGKVFVRQDAQLIDSKQSNNNLLLSGNAQVDTKPQLEIFADDVKCTHGATVGQLEKEAIFYLRSRGISEETAQIILTHAFASELFEFVKVEEIRPYLNKILSVQLSETAEVIL